MVETESFYSKNSREVQKADRALELATRAVVCRILGIDYDCTIWWNGRSWVACDYWHRPASDHEYELCLFAPAHAIYKRGEMLFGTKPRIDIRGAEDPRAPAEQREAYRSVRDELEKILGQQWGAISHEAEILFRLNDLRGFDERCHEIHGIAFGAGT